VHKPVLAANWKMNHGPSEARDFMTTFLASYDARVDRTIILFPPALTLAAVRATLNGRPDVLLGVQNIHVEARGAFTGENSAPMAADAGARVVLVGHSERRHVFGESDDATAEKCAIAFQHSLIPLLCVGEKLEEREAGKTNEVVLRQLRAGLSRVAKNQLWRVMIAYEPVWAIGTGRTAQPADASAVHRVIRDELFRMCGSNEDTDAIPILYGGSVNRDNARSLLAAPGVEGLLVGGASLDPVSWSAIASS
jgi:triosephosphate isomerase (TIM)